MTQYLGLSKNISKLQAVAPYEEIRVTEIAGKNISEREKRLSRRSDARLAAMER